MQYFSLEVKHLLEPEWSTPKQIQELPPPESCATSSSSVQPLPAPHVGPLKLLFTLETFTSETWIYRNFIYVFLKLCFCFVSALFSFPSQLSAGLTAGKKRCSMRREWDSFSAFVNKYSFMDLNFNFCSIEPLSLPKQVCWQSISSRNKKIPTGSQKVQQLKCKFKFTKTHKFGFCFLQ